MHLHWCGPRTIINECRIQNGFGFPVNKYGTYEFSWKRPLYWQNPWSGNGYDGPARSISISDETWYSLPNGRRASWCRGECDLIARGKWTFIIACTSSNTASQNIVWWESMWRWIFEFLTWQTEVKDSCFLKVENAATNISFVEPAWNGEETTAPCRIIVWTKLTWDDYLSRLWSAGRFPSWDPEMRWRPYRFATHTKANKVFEWQIRKFLV